jgi:hypothetical protein
MLMAQLSAGHELQVQHTPVLVMALLCERAQELYTLLGVHRGTTRTESSSNRLLLVGFLSDFYWHIQK